VEEGRTDRGIVGWWSGYLEMVIAFYEVVYVFLGLYWFFWMGCTVRYEIAIQYEIAVSHQI
jgi:hypothetical protein